MIQSQIFALIDIPLIFLIGALELLLSGDNAGVLALIVKDLPTEKRKKALFTGLVSASVFRAIGVIFAAYLLMLFWVQLIGGLYLIYLAVSHLCFKKPKSAPKPISFAKAVFKVEMMDVLFAIDSIVAAFALAALYYPSDLLPHKLWVIYLGGVIGILLLRMGTMQILKWLDKHPQLEKIIFLLVAWMGVELIAAGITHFFPHPILNQIIYIVFWMGTFIILLMGFLSTKWDKKV